MKIGGSLRAVWITIFALGLRCESQGGPGLVVIHYNGYELPSKSSWAGLCSPWASVGNRLFCAPLAKLSPTCVGFDDIRILLLRRAFALPNFDSSFPYQIVRMIMVRNYRKSRFSGEMFDSVSSEASRRIPRMCGADPYAFLWTRVTSPSELLRERKRQNPYHVVV